MIKIKTEEQANMINHMLGQHWPGGELHLAQGSNDGVAMTFIDREGTYTNQITVNPDGSARGGD
jgi:hypothetical protein